MGGAGSVMRPGVAALPRNRSFRRLPAQDERWEPPPRAEAMLGGGARAAKPSFVSYISPEVRGRAGSGPGSAARAGGARPGPGLLPSTAGLRCQGCPGVSSVEKGVKSRAGWSAELFLCAAASCGAVRPVRWDFPNLLFLLSLGSIASRSAR